MPSVQLDKGFGVLKLGDCSSHDIFLLCFCSSLDPCSYHFKVTNKGRQTHQLSWTTEGFSPFCRYTRLPAISNTKGKDSSQSPKPACPVFKLRPPRMELKPGKSMAMTLEGFSSIPQVRSPVRAEPSPSDHLHWGFFCNPLSFA